MKKFEACTSCGSTGSLEGSNFCSNCGARINNSEEELPPPMVSATPVENATAPIQAVAADASPTAASSSNAPVPSVEYPESASGTAARNTNDPFVASAITLDTQEFQSALYWKNPSPAMLERANSKTMGGVLFIETADLKGKFTLPRTIHVGQVLTGHKIDLSLADFIYPVTTVTMGSVLGSLSVIVPRGVRVESEGFAILGSFGGLKDGQNVHAGQVEDSPLLVIKGVTILGKVSVTVNEGVCPIRVVS